MATEEKSSRNLNSIWIHPKSWGWELNPQNLVSKLKVLGSGDIAVIVSSHLPSLFSF
jgi:enoyl reductase-like protein